MTDTGTGMPPEVVARAFEPFFTTKPLGQGTGLGLSMVYGFARQSGGRTTIRSEPGRGTDVCLLLPRHEGAAEAPEGVRAPRAVPRAGQGETVLVVDDEPVVRMLIAEVLEELGYAAIEAADGASGLRVLQSDARIDLLVSDVGLPGDMNGRQMADAARRGRPGLRVLFVTGNPEGAVCRPARGRHGRHGQAVHAGGAGQPRQGADRRPVMPPGRGDDPFGPIGAAGRRKARKRFFFEKKKQKTLASLARNAPRVRSQTG